MTEGQRNAQRRRAGKKAAKTRGTRKRMERGVIRTTYADKVRLS